MRDGNLPTRPPRRRKRGRRLLLAYAIQAVLIFLALALAVLIVCGVLYVRDMLTAGPPPEAPPAGDTDNDGSGNIRTENDAPAVPEQQERVDGVVVLDAGHGGVQPGCEFDGVLEKDITLSVTLLAAEKLRASGVTVVLTRETDEDVSLDDRCRVANGAGADLFVSIHCNSYTEDDSVSGFEGYYHNSDSGRRLAELIMSAAKALGVKTRHVKDANYQVLRETDMPSALMEIGFMSNPAERERLRSREYQDTIARAVADGVIAMLTA